jgi:hypothetical protein
MKILLGVILGMQVYSLYRLLRIDSIVKGRGMVVPWQSHAVKFFTVALIATSIIFISRSP